MAKQEEKGSWNYTDTTTTRRVETIEESLTSHQNHLLSHPHLANSVNPTRLIITHTSVTPVVLMNTWLMAESPSTMDNSSCRRKFVKMLAELGPTLPWQEKEKLLQLLLHHHKAFVVEEGERGDTDLLQMTIDTGDSPPRRQPLRCTPFAARQEITEQLPKMQEQGLVQPSCSPWASPVVLVRKRIPHCTSA